MQASEQTARAQAAFAAEGSGFICSGQQSDHLVMVAAYSGWQAAMESGGAKAGAAFARKHSLSWGSLTMLRDMRSQFASMLADTRCVVLCLMIGCFI